MRALLAEPMLEPQVIEIEDNLFAFQRLLGNHVNIAENFEEPIAIIFNEESAKRGMGNVFFFCDGHRNLRYMIGGKILVVGVSGEYPCSLTDEQIARYKRVFRSTVFYFTMADEVGGNPDQTTAPRKKKEVNRHERTGR